MAVQAANREPLLKRDVSLAASCLLYCAVPVPSCTGENLCNSLFEGPIVSQRLRSFFACSFVDRICSSPYVQLRKALFESTSPQAQR